ncbi:MAG: phosphopantetheine-binding protein [Pseudomonadota bacterium]
MSLFEETTADGVLDLVAQAFETAFANEDTRLADLPLPASLVHRGTGQREDIAVAEEALTAHRMVSQAAVVEDGGGLYGFVMPGDTGTTPLEALPQRIADAMAEDHGITFNGISLLGALPRTSTGAVNKTALRVPQQRQVVQTVKADPDVLDALKADWSDILDVPPPIASDAHFFDLGGHSVLVLRQLARIRDRWGVSLDVTALYENAELNDLARLVSAQKGQVGGAPSAPAEKDWRFMTLGTKGDVQPLIAINNAATGLAMSSVGPEPRPAYCARVADGDRGMVLTDQSFTDIAAAYADVVQSHQPKGPYLLYGNCVHGNLALEVARILQADGAEIAGVVMKDVWEPGYAAQILSDKTLARKEKWYTLRTRIRAVRDDEMSWGTLLRFYSIARKTGIVAIAERLGLIDRGHKTDLDEEQEAFISYVSRQRDIYRPEPINFPVLHIVTDITPTGKGFAPSIGWEKVIEPGNLETIHHDKVMVLRDKRVGVDLMALDLAVFLGEL